MSLARMRPATGRTGTARSWPAWTVLALSIGLWAASVGLGRAHGPLALPGIVGLALLPGPQPGGFFELGPIPNPLGWEAAGEVLRPVNAITQMVATALLGVAAVSMVLRLRRASGVQRQQLKWLAYAAVLLAGYYLLAFLYTRGTIRSVPPLIDTAVSGLGLVVVPAAIGMAVLRYRLYDIDRLINRTLVYGLLTLLLGGGYAAVALVLGQLAGRDSSLAVAAQTVEPTKASLWLRDAGRR